MTEPTERGQLGTCDLIPKPHINCGNKDWRPVPAPAPSPIEEQYPLGRPVPKGMTIEQAGLAPATAPPSPIIHGIESRPSWEIPAPATPEAPPRPHQVNPETDRCVMCGRNAFQRKGTAWCTWPADSPVGAPPAGKTVAISAKLYELITDFLKESEDIGSVGLLLLLDKERKGEEEK